MIPRPILVPVNERGDRIGEHHQRAVLTDEQVELILDLRDGPPVLTYKEIVVAMKKKGVTVSKSNVAMICRFERRAQYAASWKRVDK
jgi:hypothetical protein